MGTTRQSRLSALQAAVDEEMPARGIDGRVRVRSVGSSRYPLPKSGRTKQQRRQLEDGRKRPVPSSVLQCAVAAEAFCNCAPPLRTFCGAFGSAFWDPPLAQQFQRTPMPRHE